MFYIDCKPKIPKKEKTKEFTQNCWISPKGEFFCFEGAYHETAAAYIGCFVLHNTVDPREKGTFFNQSWESYLLKQGWVCIKNLSWLAGEDRKSIFKHHHEYTEKQKTAIFDYCEFFGYDYQQVIETE